MSIEIHGTPIEAAHEYRKRGWRTIQLHRVIQGHDVVCSCQRAAACTSKGKHPLDNEWQNTPPMSGADIQEAWTKPGRHKMNVGIATGAASGIWVLDIDPKSGGMETMAALVAEHGKLPDTFVVQTGSGGYHYYWKHAEGLRNSSGRVGKGIDTRADGGQVVAAPSVTDLGAYTVVKDLPVVEAPAWLLELAQKPESATPVITAEDLPRPEDIPAEEWDRLNAYTRRAVDANLDRLDALKTTGWEGEPWNHTTFEVSCALVELANSTWNSYSLGQAEADVFTRSPRDTAGFDDWTVKKTWSSALEKVGPKARAVPAGRAAAPADDDLFAGPDVRTREPRVAPDPTGGPSTTPGAGGPDRFFEADKSLNTHRLAMAVLDQGPLGWGRDEDFWSYEAGVWVSDREVVSRRCVSLLRGKFRTGHVANAEAYLRHLAVQIDADPVKGYLNFRNGMLDWQTGELLGHDPNFKSTVQFPHDYVADAKCPHFEGFLADILHEDFVTLAWEMMGYLLYSGNPRQVAFLFYGSGSNGKGTLMRVIEDMLGKANTASESLDDLNGNRFSAVNLFGKIANLAGDIDGTYQESTANFKKLTGEDTYPAERKFGQRFEFESWAVPVFSANKIPGSADVTEGYLRRWVILHFHKHITERIEGLSDLLAAEMPGIIAASVRALRETMGRDGFSITGEVARMKDEFAIAIDQVRQWIASGNPLQAPESWCPVHDLYQAYTVWAGGAGVAKLGEREFSHRLEAIGYPKDIHQGVVSHQGLHATVNSSQTPSPMQSFFG